MSLWDWLLAVWIYEELFDDDSDNSSQNNTYNYDYGKVIDLLYFYTQII